MRYLEKEMCVTVVEDPKEEGEDKRVPSFHHVLGQPNGFRARVTLLLADNSDQVLGVNVLPLGKE